MPAAWTTWSPPPSPPGPFDTGWGVPGPPPPPDPPGPAPQPARGSGGGGTWRLALAIAGGVAVAALAGAGGYLLVDHASSGPSAATRTPTPLPVSSTPSGGGEPPIQVGVDCSGGSPPDAYTAAAVRDICDVLVPLAAMDPSCAGTPTAACQSAAGELDQVATAALADIRNHHPATAGELAADPYLRAAFRDYATAGADLASGVADGDRALEVRGTAALTAGTEALSTAGVDLDG